MRTIAAVSILFGVACGGTPEAPVIPPPESAGILVPDTSAQRDTSAFRAAPAAAADTVAEPGDTGAQAAAPASPSQGRFLMVRNDAPVATEEFHRTAGGFDADLEIPGQVQVSYQARVTAEALIDSLAVELTSLAGGEAQRMVLTLEPSGDSAIVRFTEWEGDSTVQRSAGTRADALFYVNPSPSMMEQIVRRARVQGGDSVSVPIFMMTGAGQTADVQVTFPTADSAVATVGGVSIRMRVDDEGSFLGGTVPVQGLTIEREDAAR